MARILILTGNVLAEQRFQEILQQWNYEVLVSAAFYETLNSSILPATLFLDYFDLVVLSENLPATVSHSLLIALQETAVKVLCRTYEMSEETASKYKNDNCEWSLATDSLDKLKQRLETLICQEPPGPPNNFNSHLAEKQPPQPLFRLLSFTSKEKEILQILYLHQGQLCTQEYLAQQVWQSALSQSKKIQLYTLTGQLKKKLQTVDCTKKYLEAKRSQGYYLTPHFYQDFYLETAYMEVTKRPAHLANQ